MSGTALDKGVGITNRALLSEIKTDVRKGAVINTKNSTYGFKTHL